MPTPPVILTVPTLLNDDGSASMATALMMSHHGFRRDLGRFAIVLRGVADGDRSRIAGLAEEWRSYRNTLHGHHEAEDKGIFPHLRGQQPELAPIIDRLTADHRRIDPLLERGDRAFADLPAGAGDAASVVAELRALLDEHLALEEARIIQFIREARAFPPPASDAEAEMYAQGFAWASDGIAPEVLEKVDAMLPAGLGARLAAARAAFAERRERVWGPLAPGAARTPIPDEPGESAQK
jgi:hemerythrin-like domain-containing protein